MNELAPLRRAERPDATWPAGCAQRGYASTPALGASAAAACLISFCGRPVWRAWVNPPQKPYSRRSFSIAIRPSYVGGILEMANYPAPGRGSSETSTLKRSGSSSELGWASEPATATRR